MVSCFFAACRRCQCARRLPTNRYFPNPPGIDTAPKGSLAKGSWHAGGVTETNYNKSSRNLRIKK